ncbi:unnamed protein product [Closterium sp. Yama58-4]|nr:unnamed protein product [Closterium sp. Yama58-4]
MRRTRGVSAPPGLYCAAPWPARGFFTMPSPSPSWSPFPLYTTPTSSSGQKCSPGSSNSFQFRLSSAMADLENQIHALQLTSAPSDATASIGDVVDRLPAHVWHIIFRRLLLPPLPPSDPYGILKSPERTYQEMHYEPEPPIADAALLCCCQQEVIPPCPLVLGNKAISLKFNNCYPQWTNRLCWFLRQSGHKSLYIILSPEDLRSLQHLISPSRPSLNRLQLRLDPSCRCTNNHLSFLKDFGQLQRLKLCSDSWKLGLLDAGWFRSLRILTIKTESCRSGDMKFIAAITPQLHEFTLCGPRIGFIPMPNAQRGITSFDFEFSVARVVRFCFPKQYLKLGLILPPSLISFSALGEPLELACKAKTPLSLDHLMLYGCKLLDASSLPLRSARSVFLNGSIIDGPSSRPSSSHYIPSDISNLSLTQWLGAIAPTVEVLVVKHDLPLNKVDAEWTRLKSLGIVVNAGRAYEDMRETAVEDVRPETRMGEPGWIERSMSTPVRPPSINAPSLQTIFFPTRFSQEAASVGNVYPSLTLCCVVGCSFSWKRDGGEYERPLMRKRCDPTSSERHFALLSCAAASKRLLHHVLSFSDKKPLCFKFNERNPGWAKRSCWLLKQSGHKSLDIFLPAEKLRSLRPLLSPSKASLNRLQLRTVWFSKQTDNHLAFLKDFEQLQQLELCSGNWKLGLLDLRWFRSLRILTIKDVRCRSGDMKFLATLTPQLHEFTLCGPRFYIIPSSYHGPDLGISTFEFNFSVARMIRFQFQKQHLRLSLTLPSSLKSFSALGEPVELACKAKTPLSLDHLMLYGCQFLDTSSFPLRSAKAWLATIAPTVEVLIVKHIVPLEKVDVEWTRLKSLGVVAIFFPTRLFQMAASVGKVFPSLTMYCIVESSFFWERDGKENERPRRHKRFDSKTLERHFGIYGYTSVRQEMHAYNQQLVKGYRPHKEDVIWF